MRRVIMILAAMTAFLAIGISAPASAAPKNKAPEIQRMDPPFWYA